MSMAIVGVTAYHLACGGAAGATLGAAIGALSKRNIKEAMITGALIGITIAAMSILFGPAGFYSSLVIFGLLTVGKKNAKARKLEYQKAYMADIGMPSSTGSAVKAGEMDGSPQQTGA